MIITIGQAIENILRKMNAPRITIPVPVSNEDIAQLFERLALTGYRPAPQIVEPLRDYLSGYSLLLRGETGVGKTFLLRCLGVRLYDAKDIVRHGLADIGDWFDWTDEHDICIDDLGIEGMLSEYGAKEELMTTVISHRCDQQTSRHDPNSIDPPRVGRTHITTNLSAEQIAGRYGDRTLSRLLGMCKPHTLTGPSQRLPTPESR